MLTQWFENDRTYSLMDDLRRRMDLMFEDIETGRAWTGEAAQIWPRANLFDSGENYVLQAELPGVAKEDLSISGCQDCLTISGERKVTAPEGYTVHRQERGGLRFSRSFRFPVKIDADHATAELKNGILTVSIPKAPELKPRSIEVKAN